MKFRQILLCLAASLILNASLNCAFGLVPGDEHWDNRFGSAGLNSTAAGIAVVGKNVYAAGTFVTAAGNTRANGVAGFDGTNWFPLNSGLLNNGAVIAVNTDGQYLYVSGLFTNADDSAARNSARWDGTNWSNIGITGLTYAHKKSGTNLYVGGVFTTAGGQGITNIARWDGMNWYPLGSGITNNGSGNYGVTTIAIQGNNIYAGGIFPNAGNVAATNVAYFDGSAWHAMGNPFPSGGVLALTFVGNLLYAGGYFTNAALGITNIARWNGSTWSALPGSGPNNSVYDLATDGTNLYAGGVFTKIGGIAATNIAKFDGTNWTALGSGVHFFQNSLGQVNKLFWNSNQLYVAGGFDAAGSVGCANVARWDGSNWWSLGGETSKGFVPSLNFISVLRFLNPVAFYFPAGLYAGGLFTTAGKTNATEIAYFDGNNWNAVGSGMMFGSFGGTSSRVSALATDGAYLYAGGSFTNAGGNGANCIAQWDGSNWSPLGNGVDSTVNAIAVGAGNYIWVGGIFTNSGAGYSRGLSTYASGSWYNFGNVEGTNGTVNALAYDGNNYVFIGGSFFTAGGNNATNIAYFDYNDYTFHPLGQGFNARVNALAYANGLLYAGGSFTKSGNIVLNHIAQWDGATWSPLGNGLIGSSTASVSAIAVTGNNVYVTGPFTNAGGVTVTNVAKWDGVSWSAMGNGPELGRAANAVAASGDDVYIGGTFNFAGDKPSQFIAHWNATTNFYPAANMLLTRTMWQTNRQVRFRVTGTSGQSYIIQASTNLTAWVPVFTNSTMFYDFLDPNSSLFVKRYYRTVLGP